MPGKRVKRLEGGRSELSIVNSPWTLVISEYKLLHNIANDMNAPLWSVDHRLSSMYSIPKLPKNS